jgi:hypothetical protein
VDTVDGMTNTAIASRNANALILGATARRSIPPRRLIEAMLRPLRSMVGGLWVGGVAELQRDVITFTPNSVNRAVHDGDLDVVVALRDVMSVTVKRGLCTHIITVAAAENLVIRCYRADKFAEQIRAAVRATG